MLERLIGNRERFVTDVEAYQEILHMYVAIGQPDAIDAGITRIFSFDRGFDGYPGIQRII